jgi:hypothetical protein
MQVSFQHRSSADVIERIRQAAVVARHSFKTSSGDSRAFLEALEGTFGGAIHSDYADIVALLEEDEQLTPEERGWRRPGLAGSVAARTPGAQSGR